ncbi:MAG: hypothetical protein ACRYHA_02170 [Janthinobacterium lividum]
MKKIALLFVGGLIVSAAFQQGYAEASKRVTPAVQAGEATADTSDPAPVRMVAL